MPLLLLAACRGAIAQPAEPSARSAPDRPVEAERPVSPAELSRAIDLGVNFIWAQQNGDGHWEPMIDKMWNARPRDSIAPIEQLNRGGLTALALLALRHAGQNPRDPRFAKALDWLVQQDGQGTYFRGLRAALYATLPDEPYNRLLKQDAQLLYTGIWPAGAYGYSPCPPDQIKIVPTGDYSNTQYGVLGVWSAASAGVPVPDRYWLRVQRGYLAGQQRDGGWGYQTIPDHLLKTPTYPGSRDGLTLGGLASLFVVWDRYYAADCKRKVDPEMVVAIGRANDWLADHYERLFSRDVERIEPYSLYALERAGVASGMKYFGRFDWWRSASRVVVKSQFENGCWPTAHHRDVAGTAWTLLFLTHGRGPVVFNKLVHGRPDDWNARPRDLAGVTAALGDIYENKFNWQTVSLDSSQADLQDAPILWITGRHELALTEPQKRRLRDYVLRGGTIVAAPAGEQSRPFVLSIKLLLLELFPAGKLQPLPAGDPLLNSPARLDSPPPLLAMGNGIRWTVLLADGDLGCQWQSGNRKSNAAAFAFARNLYAYVSDGGRLRDRGHSYLLTDAGRQPARAVTVGRARWSAGLADDPEPLAWTHQDIRLRNADVMRLNIRDVDLGRPIRPADVPLLHLTGIGPIELAQPARENLKAYLNAGGLLLVDDPGGRADFVRSAQHLLGDLFPGEPLAPAPTTMPFLRNAGPDGKVWFRHRWDMPRSQRPLGMLMLPGQAGGRPRALVLPFDLTAAMVGYPSAAPAGLTPESADQFVTALLQWLAGEK